MRAGCGGHHIGRRAPCDDPREAGGENWGHVAFIRGQPIVMGEGENSLRDNLEVIVQVGMCSTVTQPDGLSPQKCHIGLMLRCRTYTRETRVKILGVTHGHGSWDCLSEIFC